MNQIFKLPQSVQLMSFETCIAEEYLGGGGQGEVYRARLATSNQNVALKWYFPAGATAEQRSALEVLVDRGRPTDKFLWPIDIATAPGVNGYGYIMPLRDPSYKSIVDLMKRRINPSFHALATAGFELAHSFVQLHAKGLCYCDISFGNVFFNPDNGSVLICDNDNVAVDGANQSSIRGTPRFMAPEIVRDEAGPSIQTDLYSLAVLLFYMFVVHHPLEGRKESLIRCLDAPAMNMLYGTDPVFIFDPTDNSNRPVPDIHDNAILRWPLFPKFFRDLFVRAFTIGLTDPRDRIRESEWRRTMIKLRDSIIYCAVCGAENFYDIDYLKSSGGKTAACWHCKTPVVLPFRMRVVRPDGEDVVMLNRDTQLYAHHLDKDRRFDFSAPIAEVAQHPTNPSMWGLQNRSQATWDATTSDGTSIHVPPARSVTLAVGTKINFGTLEGEIRY